jgi:Bacterial Ig-like domain (group 1)
VRSTFKVRRPAAVLATALVWLMAASQALAVDSFTPSAVDVTLRAGESTTVNKTLHLDALPGAADIIIAIDTTGSMDPAIAQAKAEAIQICTQVKAQIPGARFAVVDIEDYPLMPSGGGGDLAYALLTPGYVADCMTFATAINTMVADGGGDAPEAFNREFFESYSDPLLVENPNAVQFNVVLGDAAPHSATAFGACPASPPDDFGRNNIPGGGDDINTADAIDGMVANDITLLMIHYQHGGTSTPLGCYEDLAEATGGTAVSGGGGADLSNQIVAAIQAAAAQIDEVQLVVSGPGCQTAAGLTIAFNPPFPMGPFTAPVNISFQETITAPTAPGIYSCTVTAVVDGTPRAIQSVRATVTPGLPAMLSLTPETDTNTVDDQHCVTARVTDAFGNPAPGVTVNFSVTPPTFRTPSGGSATTDASGRAVFCYRSALPGTDIITATAQGGTNPTDTATKTWVLPTNDEGCKVTNGGRITAANGDKATFGGNAQGKGPKGQEEYQDHGPATNINVHSINVLAVTCSPDGTRASIFGKATVNGAGSFDYRIDVKDLAEPGRTDTYRIRLSNGYDSGEKVLSGGNIQIH